MMLTLDARKNLLDVVEAAHEAGPRSKPVVRKAARGSGWSS